MLEKIPNCPHISKLRIIHLIESDFNMTMGILWGKRLMAKGEELHQFGEEQRLARKNKQCTDVLLLKHLTYSTARLAKANGTTFDNDAKSCYDRIVMLFASLASQRLGMPAKACKFFLQTLSEVQYRTSKAHGISDSTYSTNDDHGIHGPGQGGRASPPIWTVIKNLLLACMNTSSNGLYLTDPFNQFMMQQTSSGFVDDITHWNIDMRPPAQSMNDIEIITEALKTAQYWVDLLYTSGRKICLDKSMY
jgi:hypothetical protein